MRLTVNIVVVFKRYNNTIYKRFLKSKKTIKVILSNITRIRLIIYIEDPKEAFSVNYVYIKKDTKVKEITVVDIVIIGYPIRSNIIFIINRDTS